MNVRDEPGGSRPKDEKCVFLVNPASANGSTGRRWPELARRAAAAGLEGDTLFSERPGHLVGARARGGARRRRPARRRRRRRIRQRGRERPRRASAPQPDVAVIARGTGWDFVRTFGIPRKLERGGADRARGRRPHDRPRPRLLPRLGRLGRDVDLRERRQRRHERRDRQARERDDEGARRQGLVPLGDVRRLLGLAGDRRSS